MTFKQTMAVWILGFLAVVSLLWLAGYSSATALEQVRNYEMQCFQSGGHIDKDTRSCTK